MTAGGVLATAPSAGAAGGCPSSRLCVWDGTNFTGHRILSASTNSCFYTGAFTFGYIRSYSNNLPVDATVWQRDDIEGDWYEVRTLVAGKFSSDIGIYGLGAGGAVCEGSQTP
ncbi:peptidase inhibitor family I36 protein [Streptomyces sp. NPDC046985]|uniref:peptidase inhibitor family I36 protein n=1 Tax=Streptomyces sp. NPDC046985 TaxID=3155377 RepID=UPI0033C640ED